MASIVVPGLDLAPSVPSRIVTVDVIDMTEGAPAAGAVVDFILPQDLHAPADGKVLKAGTTQLTLDSSGHGEIRVPAYSAATKPEDWVLLVKKHWAPYPYAIRVPTGTTKISLAALTPPVEVTDDMSKFLITAATATLQIGGVEGVDVDVAGGIAHFDFRFPSVDSAAAWQGSVIAASDDLDAATTPGIYRVSSVSAGNLPVAQAGTLTVAAAGGTAGRTQTYTTVEPAPRMWVRRYTGTAWGSWSPITWRVGSLTASDDLDGVTTPGIYQADVNSIPNLPSGLAGTLEVMWFSLSGVIQRFTTANPLQQFLRRSNNGGETWGNWTLITSTGGGNGSAAGVVSGLGVPAREPLTVRPVTMRTAYESSVPFTLSRDRTTCWSRGGSALRESKDFGETWVDLTDKSGVNPFAGMTIESVSQMENGELLIVVSVSAESRRAVYVTNGYPTGTWTVTRTMTARAKHIRFPVEWSVDTKSRIILLTEYGPKLPTWEDEEITVENAARYVWMSVDYGQTWTNIFDVIAYVSEQEGVSTFTGQIHGHSAVWDPYWDRIWFCFGDDRDGVVYSDDLGATWKTGFYSPTETGGTQGVGMVVMPDCLLIAADMGPSPRVLRISRSAGKFPAGGAYTLETAFNLADVRPAWASEKQFCRGISRVHRLGDDAPALFAFSPDTQAGHSFVVATLDGVSFTLLWADQTGTPAGIGSRSMIGPTLSGEFIWSMLRESGQPREIYSMAATGY